MRDEELVEILAALTARFDEHEKRIDELADVLLQIANMLNLLDKADD